MNVIKKFNGVSEVKEYFKTNFRTSNFWNRAATRNNSFYNKNYYLTLLSNPSN